MSQEQTTLDPQQREALRQAKAPDGLWTRIEAAARLSLESGAGAAQDPFAQQGVQPGTEGRSKWRLLRGDALRMAAAGMLGFFAFFGMQQVVTSELRSSANTSTNAAGMQFAEHLRDEVPLFDEKGGLIIPEADLSAWPEVVLATYFTNTESH